MLFESYETRSEQSTRIFTEYSKRLHAYVEHAREAQRGKTAVSDTGPESAVKRNQSADKNKILIETLQERTVRQACECLAENLIEKIKTTFPAYDGGGSHPDPQLEVAKLGYEVDSDGIPEEVRETALSSLKSPPLLLQALAAYTSRIVASISLEAEEIDIRGDAEHLRYTCKPLLCRFTPLTLQVIFQEQ